MNVFAIAPMSAAIRAMTLLLSVLPGLLVLGAVWGATGFLVPAVLILAAYAYIWLYLRPIRFVVGDDTLEVVWPLRRRQILRSSIAGVCVVNNQELKKQIGWAVRIGAGGMWGGFGWLWTQRKGIFQMYTSRSDDLVWLELAAGRPWLISPERPGEFVQALSDRK